MTKRYVHCDPNFGYLYRHIRLDRNEPFYIGIARCDNGKYHRAYSACNRNRIWNGIVSKTGYEVDILFDEMPMDFIKKKEIEFISLYKRKGEGGTLSNISGGGDGMFQPIFNVCRGRKRSQSEIDKQKKTVAEKIKNGTYKKTTLGMKHSDATRAAMSIKRKGEFGSMFGKFGYAKHSKIIVQIEECSGVVLSEYPSINRAATLNGFSVNHLLATVSDKYKHRRAYGFIWKLKSEL